MEETEKYKDELVGHKNEETTVKIELRLTFERKERAGRTGRNREENKRGKIHGKRRY